MASAREQIIGLLGGGSPANGLREIAERVADEILSNHARELAGKIRTEAAEWDGWPEKQVAMGFTADLICPRAS